MATRKRTFKKHGALPIDTEGKLFRVRDKDYMDGTEVKIWGENLTYEAAHKLKEKVVGAKKSRTARIEEMSVPLPSADPTLESVRQKALAAGRGAAVAATHRAHNVVRKRQEAAAASAPRPRVVPGRPLPKPVPMKMELEDDDDFEVPDVVDEIDEQDHPEAVAAAVVVDDEINEYEQRGKSLYDAWVAIQAEPAKFSIWEKLGAKEQAAFSFEATSEQGPHIEALKAAMPTLPENGNGVATPTAS